MCVCVIARAGVFALVFVSVAVTSFQIQLHLAALKNVSC